MLHVACLQIGQHERKHHRHADAGAKAEKLKLLGQCAHAACHFVDVAQIRSARKEQRDKQYQQNQHAHGFGYPRIKRIILHLSFSIFHSSFLIFHFDYAHHAGSQACVVFI